MTPTQLFIQKHRFDDVRKLAFKPCPPDVDLTFALSQIAGRQVIRNKIPSWYDLDDILYPVHLSLEQCSSEATAKYKASLVNGQSFVDLTGGFGVDCAFLSCQFQSGTYVEQQNMLCEITEANFRTLGLKHIQVECNNAVEYLGKITQKIDCIYLDPARRNNSGEKIVSIQDCNPNIHSIKEQLINKAETVMIKLSPMLDIPLALKSLPETSEVHIVSINGECKELLFILRNTTQQEDPKIVCVNILKDLNIQYFSFLKTEEQNAGIEYCSEPQSFIYEPNASVLKAGAYKSIALKYNLRKFHPDSHLYTSSELSKNFPGRIFKLISAFSFNKKELKENLGGITQANISIRNFPGTVDDLRKKLKLKDGGDIYLFATTLFNENKIILMTEKFIF